MTRYSVVDMIRSGAEPEQIASVISWSLDADDLITLAVEYMTTKDEDRRERIADLLTECNYHTEREHLERGEIAALCG